LPIRLLDHELGLLADVAQRLPDPRAQKFATHSREALLTQEGYLILAGYPDGNDAQALRDDPLFQTLVGVAPNEERSLASGSTLHRFHHAYTRRQAQVPLEERPVLREIDAALAYALVVLHREATASIPEIAHAEVNTLRQRLWKVGAVVKTSVRRIWFHVWTSWPERRLFERVYVAVRQFIQSQRREMPVLPMAGFLPLL
jgi:hypothetical protein